MATSVYAERDRRSGGRNRAVPEGSPARPVPPVRARSGPAAVTALQRSAGNRAVVQAMAAGASPPRLQRQDPAPAPDAAPYAPPILFGYDAPGRRVYASVINEGATVTDISRYIYGTPDKAAELRSVNGVPERVGPGRNLVLVEGALAAPAQAALERGRRDGTMLRTSGIATGIADQGGARYRLTLDGAAVELGEAQMRGLLNGQVTWLAGKARYIHGVAEGSRDVHQGFFDDTNSVIRGISDWMADQDELPVSVWAPPMDQAQAIIDALAGVDPFTLPVDQAIALVVAQARGLVGASDALSEAEGAWHRYIEGTISGAERTAGHLETVRNTSFAIAAGLAGAAVAPAVFAAAGTGLGAVGVTGTTATVLSGTAAVGAGAVAGGVTQGTLDVVAPGMQAGRSAGDRFTSGFGQGMVSGGLGAVGGLVAPGVAGGISRRLYGVAPGALTGGARAVVSSATGAVVGAPLGAAGSAITNAAALARGEIDVETYLERIGWGTLSGTVFGAGFGLLGAVGGRRPTALAPRPGGRGGGRGGAAEPDVIYTRVTVDRASGTVVQDAYVVGLNRWYRAEFNPVTGRGRIIDLATGEPVAHYTDGRWSGTAGPTLALPAGTTAPAGGAASGSGGAALVRPGTGPTTGGQAAGRPGGTQALPAVTVDLRAARTAVPAASGELSTIESALASSGVQGHVVNDIAQLQAVDGRVAGFEHWARRAHGSANVVVRDAANPARAAAVADARRDLRSAIAELNEVRRLAIEHRADPDALVRYMPGAHDAGRPVRGFDTLVESRRGGAMVPQVRTEVFVEEAPIAGAAVFDTGIIHAAAKVPRDVVSGVAPRPPERLEATVAIEWPPAGPVGQRLYHPDGTYVFLRARHRGGDLPAELLGRLNGALGRDARVVQLDAVTVVDRSGRVVWRFTNTTPGTRGGWAP
jgi:hypothetical protein